MNCKQCGAPVKDGMNFCPKCGCRVKSHDVFSVADKTLTVDDMKKIEEMNAQNARRKGNPQNQGIPVNNNQRSQHGNRDASPDQVQQNPQMGQQMQDLKSTPIIPQTEIHNPNDKYDNNQNNLWNVSSAQKPPKKVKKQSGVSSGICIFLSILLFLSLIISVVLTFVHTTYSNERIEKWINEEEIYKLKLPVIYEDGTRNKSVSDVVYEAVIYYIDSDLIVSRGDVKNLLKKRMVKDFMAEVALEYIDYVFRGEMAEGITPERFADFMIENKTEILSALAKDLRMYELEEYVDEQGLFDRQYIIEEANFYLGDSSSILALDEEYGYIISCLRFFISKTFMIIMWGITVVLVLAIILLCLSNMVNVLSYTGSSLVTAGGCLLVIKLIISFFAGTSTSSAIYKIADLLMSKLSLFGSIFLIVGILMIIVRVIFWAVQKRSFKKYYQTV